MVVSLVSGTNMEAWKVLCCNVGKVQNRHSEGRNISNLCLHCYDMRMGHHNYTYTAQQSPQKLLEHVAPLHKPCAQP